MMVDVWRVWGNWAVCSSGEVSEAIADDGEVDEEDVVRIVSHSPMLTLYPSGVEQTIT